MARALNGDVEKFLKENAPSMTHTSHLSHPSIRSRQIDLLAERLAVALFKSKSTPIDEPKRKTDRRIAD